VKWLDWHGSSALTRLSHPVEDDANPNSSTTGGIAIEILDDSDEEDDQLWRENATPEPSTQPPAGRRIESPAGREEHLAGREEHPAGRNEERVAREMRKLDTFYNPTDPSENANETVLQVSMSSIPGHHAMKRKQALTGVVGRKSRKRVRRQLLQTRRMATCGPWVSRPQSKDLGNEERLQSEARSLDRGIAVQSSQYRERLHATTSDQSFAIVVGDTAIRLTLAISLYEEQKNDDWAMEAIDVEAAFLEGQMDHELFIDLPYKYQEYCVKRGIKLGANDVIHLKNSQNGCVQRARI
jgi:hypothetical protein